MMHAEFLLIFIISTVSICRALPFYQFRYFQWRKKEEGNRLKTEEEKEKEKNKEEKKRRRERGGKGEREREPEREREVD